MIENKNALAELANKLTWIEDILRSEGYDSYCDEANKAQRIVAELAKEFEPIDLSLVERGADGRKHISDFVKATDRRRCEIMIKCRAIAEEGANNGK